MRTLDFKSRFAFVTAISYFLPIFFFALSLFNSLPTAIGFWTLAIGWFLIAGGTLLVFINALYYEKEVRTHYPQEPTLAEENHALKQQLLDNRRKTKDDPGIDPKKLTELTKELENARSQGLQLLKDKEKLVAELQNTIAKQKKLIEDKDVILSKFQSKITEMTYEIKSLVQTSPENEPLSHAKPLVLQESSILLRRCIALAQQHTGAWSFNPNMGRDGNLSIDSYTLDQRRYYHALNREKGGMIFLYSPKEEKILYVNQAVKNLLNITPETFTQDFNRMIESRQPFEEAIKKLPQAGATQLTLQFKSQPALPCYLDLIPTGLFKNHVVGVVLF